MRILGVVFAAVLTVAGLGAVTPPATAASTTVVLTASGGYSGQSSTLSIVLTADGGPLADARVQVLRRVRGTWRPLTEVTTDPAGRATATAVIAQLGADNVFRAEYAGTTGPPAHPAARSAPVTARLTTRSSVLTLGGPTSVIDERSTVITVSWRTGNGQPVAGPVRLERRDGRRWVRIRVLRTSSDGAARYRLTPRVDTRWRARAAGLDWVAGDTSGVHRIDNRPSGDPVSYPGNAPRPRVKMPRQQRAVGAGAHPVVSRIPGGIWSQMTGRSWHAGCPVGRAGLRLLRINYWGYDGYRYRGEVVAAAGAVAQMSGALAEMYQGHFPIRSMYRVDRFGWSRAVRGANDYRSMAAGNTSAFNCRDVVNKPGVRSPHSYGRALDVNTWENPYRSATGLVPNTWWQSRSNGRYAWRSGSHPVVRIMARHGLRWTYGNGDTQHFDAAGRSGRLEGRVLTAPDCGEVACD